jgi:hypothetical protein
MPGMTEPDGTDHTAEPAEGAEQPGTGEGGQTPHTEEPAEGAEELPEGYNVPGP